MEGSPTCRGGDEGRSRGGRHKTSAGRPGIGRNRGPGASPEFANVVGLLADRLDEMKGGPALGELGVVRIRLASTSGARRARKRSPGRRNARNGPGPGARR